MCCAVSDMNSKYSNNRKKSDDNLYFINKQSWTLRILVYEKRMCIDRLAVEKSKSQANTQRLRNYILWYHHRNGQNETKHRLRANNPKKKWLHKNRTIIRSFNSDKHGSFWDTPNDYLNNIDIWVYRSSLIILTLYSPPSLSLFY